MATLLIKNGRIWDGERFQSGGVLTNGKLIEKIDATIEDSAEYIFDAAGKIVCAGLVDLHVHMKGVSSNAFGIEPHMSSLPFGVTAVNDAGSIYGEKALLDSFAINNTVFVGVRIRENCADLTGVDTLLERYGDKAVGLKVCFDTTLGEIRDIAPLQELCGYAKSKGLKVMVHCSNSPTSMAEIVRTLSAGDILTHIYHGGNNACTDNDFEAFTLARQKGVVMDTGFAGYVHTNFANFKKAVSAGFLPDTISTDITCYSAYKRGGRYGMTMCMSMAKVVGMGEEDIFKAVTSSPAKALGKGNAWGYLVPGRRADIAVFDYTDEAFCLTDSDGTCLQSDTGYRCVFTVCDGQIVYRG